MSAEDRRTYSHLQDTSRHQLEFKLINLGAFTSDSLQEGAFRDMWTSAKEDNDNDTMRNVEEKWLELAAWSTVEFRGLGRPKEEQKKDLPETEGSASQAGVCDVIEKAAPAVMNKAPIHGQGKGAVNENGVGAMTPALTANTVEPKHGGEKIIDTKEDGEGASTAIESKPQQNDEETKKINDAHSKSVYD